MAVKTAFEPKDARITFEERYYSSSSNSSSSRGSDGIREPRKRITGTQALVEFLNTTSPEEFQKVVVPTTKRSPSALFFKRKSGESKAVMTTNNTSTTIHRKSYIEIIANPFMFNKTKATSSDTPSSNKSKNNNVAIIGSKLNSTSINQHYDNPVLPITNRKGGTGNQIKCQPPSLRIPPAATIQQDNHYINSIFANNTFSTTGEDDIIEGGLKQRLKHHHSLLDEKPSDSISKSLAHEHILALKVVSIMVMDEQYETPTKKRSRHMQVQTMPYNYPNNPNVVVITQNEKQCNNVITDNEKNIKQKLEKIEKELKQEKLISSRLQAALEETRDQFEVLSGLAYKKLREVWEEKTRWENACIEAKEKCWQNHQQQILGHHANNNDLLLSSSFMVDTTVMEDLI